jgi:hypothetical protein
LCNAEQRTKKILKMLCINHFFLEFDSSWNYHNSEISIYTHKKIKFDVVFFLLALVIKNDVFDEIISSTQLWRQRVFESDTLLELRMKRSKLDLSMLRTITRSEEISDRILDDLTFHYYFQRIVINADYYDTYHSCLATRSRECRWQ